MKTFKQIVTAASESITEIMPWDVADRIKKNDALILIDIHEECEFAQFHIKNAILIPRGILESACEKEYDDANPALVAGRDKEIILICRSGSRSSLGTQTLQTMGFTNICSMKTGLRGWNDYELPLYNTEKKLLDPDDVEKMLSTGFCATSKYTNRQAINA
ncbi:MAG: rhodanese-like domain-containing protein [Gammaproteobacteria bacterium]|nr:rhodanese-like domain-containing protein [Gammaproteobacteria bacterium]